MELNPGIIATTTDHTVALSSRILDGRGRCDDAFSGVESLNTEGGLLSFLKILLTKR